jgi:tight adherence protein C
MQNCSSAIFHFLIFHFALEEAMNYVADIIPLLVFVGIVLGIWALLSGISNRNSKAADRLSRMSRPPSLSEIEDPAKQKGQHFAGLLETAKALSSPLMPHTEVEQSNLKTKLANAGFRSEAAPVVYSGLRLACLLVSLVLSCAIFLPGRPLSLATLQWPIIFTGIGFYIPSITLWYLRSKRQEAIFLTLPDALDLLVVCVESGLGLDAALRKVCEEMSGHAKVICEEFSLANFQLQMGRPRREVLHDLGVRTGVDDVRSLAAILIQADRFGSSIAQALRVQSDSMRTRRKQIAEEKAAKTAVQLLFPLILFIFPGIFVVLVGPAAINIMETLLKQ